MKKYFLFGFGLLLLSGGFAFFLLRDTKSPRNLVIICFDTVRYDAFQSPKAVEFDNHFSRWAKDAVRFQNAQSPAPWTVPAVASAFSGLYPVQHTAGRFESPIANLDRMKPSSLPDQVETLAEILRNHHFLTAAFVAQPWFRPTNLSQGFSEFHFVKDSKIKDVAKRWLTDNRFSLQPFFLYLHYMEAHDAHMHSMDESAEITKAIPYRLKLSAIHSAPAGICADPTSDACVRYQIYVKSMIDLKKSVADLLTFLDQKHMLKNTIVVVFSDHGEEFSDHLHEEQIRGADSRGYYGVGHGHSMYQELLHVPLFVWHPLFSDRDISTPVSLVDLTPTLIKWFKINESHSNWSGRNLADLRYLDQRRALINTPLFSTGIAYGPDQTALLWKGWKRIDLTSPKMSIFFDLQHDPNESNPAMEGVPQKETDQLIAVFNRMNPRSPLQEPKLNKEEIEQLKSVGYLTATKSEK